jgi:hypothetical protein
VCRAGQVTFKKKLPLIWSVEWVKISDESYQLLFILWVISAESYPLATKVTLKVIPKQKISVESYPLPRKSVKRTMARFPHENGTGDKGQGAGDKGQETEDKGPGTRGNRQGTGKR